MGFLLLRKGTSWRALTLQTDPGSYRKGCWTISRTCPWLFATGFSSPSRCCCEDEAVTPTHAIFSDQGIEWLLISKDAVGERTVPVLKVLSVPVSSRRPQNVDSINRPDFPKRNPKQPRISPVTPVRKTSLENHTLVASDSSQADCDVALGPPLVECYQQLFGYSLLSQRMCHKRSTACFNKAFYRPAVPHTKASSTLLRVHWLFPRQTRSAMPLSCERSPSGTS